MTKFSRSFSKSACFGLALALGIVAAPRPAEAQWAVTDPDLDVLMGAIGLKLDTDMAALGVTINENSAVASSLNGKAADYNAKNAYVLEQNKAQAQEASNFAPGGLNFQRNNLCQQTTLTAGRSSVKNAVLTELSSYNGYRAQSSQKSPTLSNSGENVYTLHGSNQGNQNQPICTTCGGGKGPAGVIGYEYTADPLSKRVMDLATTATAFFGQAETGNSANENSTWNSSNGANLVATSMPKTDNTTPTTHLDVDVLSLELQPTYSDVEQAAHDQLSNYIVGLPRDIISAASTFKGSGTTLTPQFASALIANREQTAYRELSSVAWDKERSYHDGVKTGAQASITAIFSAANLADPSWKDQNGDQVVSEAAIDQALYAEPADDPNFATNFASQNNKSLLEFIAVEMTMLNAMEYRRYLQETDMLKVESASLNLQARNFNFATNP